MLSREAEPPDSICILEALSGKHSTRLINVSLPVMAVRVNSHF